MRATSSASIKSHPEGVDKTAGLRVVQQALRLGTQDARLLYHAGVIARAAGDRAAASDYLKRALALNPQFDPLQSKVARKVLES